MSGVVGDGSVDADDALLEKAREDVVGSFASGRVLNHHRDQAVGSICSPLCEFSSPSMEELVPD